MSHQQQQQQQPQQQPQQPYRGGGGGGRGGGRQGGRGGGQHQQQPNFPGVAYGGPGGPPLQPWVYQQQQQPHQQLQHQQQQRPQPYQPMPPPYGYNPYGGYYPTPPHLLNPPQHRGAPYGAPPTMMANIPHNPQDPRGGVFYPQPMVPAVAPTMESVPLPRPSFRERKPLVITDKQGKPLNFDTPPTKQASAPAAPPVAIPATTSSVSAEEAGQKLKQAVLERMAGDSTAYAKKTLPETKNEPTPAAPMPQNKPEAIPPPKEEEPVPQAEAAKKEPEPSVEPSEPEPAPKVERTPEPETVTELEPAKAQPLPSTTDSTTNGEKIQQTEQLLSDKKSDTARPVAPVKKKSLAALVKETADKPITERKKRSHAFYTKKELLGLKELSPCKIRPADLADFSIVVRREDQRNNDRRVGADRRSDRRGSQKDGGDQWARGSAPPRRQNSQSGGSSAGGTGGGGSEWSRGQAPPRQQSKGNRRSGRGTGHQQSLLYDGPVAPLIKSDNHWKPKKNASAFIVAEKKVKSILNKMTKEKFDRLSSQMLEIPILSYQTLTMMLDNVYDKAIDEPSFGDMYADLCVRLSQSVQGNEFVHVIESDEEPPTDDGQTPSPDSNDGSSHIVYRWSNDVSTSDSEVVGPLSSEEECIEVALNEPDRTPELRGDMELELVKVSIRHGRFIKIMKKKGTEEGESESFYVVFFPVAEAEDCGQQLSEIFLSEVECKSDASKKNAFKRSLLNKCEEEFNKQDIYVDWQKEKAAYEESKAKMTDAEQAEKEEELNFRRIRIKKQMLGNVKFIGQLYKKTLIKEKIMRFCIASTLKLVERTDIQSKNPEYNIGSYTDMDEEDHEAICSMFSTIGSMIDTAAASNFMDVCFTKIQELSRSKDLPVRSKFMYKDLIDLRSNHWVPRRNEEKAKTIAEIRKDVEREEREQAQPGRGGRGGDVRTSARGGNRGSVSLGSSLRSKVSKPVAQTDDDGFTQIVSGRSGPTPLKVNRIQVKPDAGPLSKKSTFAALAEDKAATQNGSSTTTAQDNVATLSNDQLQRKIKSMRNDFINDGGNIEELVLTWQEIAGTSGAGQALVTQNVEHMFEAKDTERSAIYQILAVLCDKEKLTRKDVQEGLAEPLEFIDSVVMDSPRAYEYVGIVIADMLRMKMIDVTWLCDQYKRIVDGDSSTHAPESITRHLVSALQKSTDSKTAKSYLSDPKLKEAIGAVLVEDLLSTLS